MCAGLCVFVCIQDMSFHNPEKFANQPPIAVLLRVLWHSVGPVYAILFT